MLRPALLIGFLVPVACQASAPPSAPAVDVRREPANRAEIDAFGLQELASGKPGKGPPPDEPVAPSADIGQCLRSRMCGFEGLCSPSEEGGLCIAASDEDCEPSDACLGGRCTAKGGVCIAANDEDCRSSWACKGWGRCFHDGQEACAAKAVADCRASTRCKREGECRLVGDVCGK